MPWLNAAVFLAILLPAAAALARYMQALFEGRARLWGEAAIFRWCGIDPQQEMGWAEYAKAAILFSLVTTLAAYAIMRTQQWHGHFFNPQHFPNVDRWIAWNTAVSFVTTTDWQFYAGENTMSYLSQMAALAWLNFIAGAIGLAAGVAVIRGFARKGSATLGNFWVDCTRSLLYVLLPLCVLFALLYASQGIPQNFSRYFTATNAGASHRASLAVRWRRKKRRSSSAGTGAASSPRTRHRRTKIPTAFRICSNCSGSGSSLPRFRCFSVE